MKANILPNYDDDDVSDDENRTDIQLELKRIKELEEVQVLIDKLVFDDPFTAEEFVECDKSETTGEMISDEEILKAVLPNEQEKEREEDSLPTITYSEAIEAYDKVILHLKQREEVFDVNKEELKFIKKLKKEALKQQFISACQTNLNSFVSIIE
jgi:hypothetical protein